MWSMSGILMFSEYFSTCNLLSKKDEEAYCLECLVVKQLDHKFCSISISVAVSPCIP